VGNVIDLFAARTKAPAPSGAGRSAAPGNGARDVREPEGPAIKANALTLLAQGGVEGLNHLEEQGAAMAVLSALLFYAHQGQDDGKRARRAVVAMQELLTGAPEVA